jgi:pantetheine-phosphate adenylyltransferase
MQKKFGTVAVGGTFDEFHKGHRALLLRAFDVGDRVLIGVSDDSLVQRMMKPHVVATYEVRVEEVKGFLRKNGLLDRATIVPLCDSYGVTLTSEDLQGLVVSRETESVATEINRKRKATGLPPLEIIVIDMIPAENHVPISTTRIREMEIDHEGHMLKPQRR